MRTGGKVEYDTFTPDDVRAQLRHLGQEVENLEREEKLTITDWYSASLGQKSKEKYSHPTLKMPELSIYWSQKMQEEPEPDFLDITDQESTFARFNDEKAWVEVTPTRIIPVDKILKSINFITVVEGSTVNGFSTQPSITGLCLDRGLVGIRTLDQQVPSHSAYGHSVQVHFCAAYALYLNVILCEPTA